jgi:hypothetical protein
MERSPKMEWINPHAWIHIKVTGADGSVVEWMIEGGNPNILIRGVSESSRCCLELKSS